MGLLRLAPEIQQHILSMPDMVGSPRSPSALYGVLAGWNNWAHSVRYSNNWSAGTQLSPQDPSVGHLEANALLLVTR